MRLRLHGRTAFTLVGALLALQWSLTAQSSSLKRPITYDVMDSWKSIQGTRLSDDGQWLAYATSAPGDDGELVVRNLRSGQEIKHARGTSPAFTPDGKFVVFTIAQPRAEEEREAAAETPAAEGQGGRAAGSGQAGRGNARREPRTGMGIITLADGQVKTFEKVGSFSLPEKSSTWLAYHKGLGGNAGGGRGGGRGGAGGRAGGAGGRGTTPAATEPGGGRQNASREKRNDRRGERVRVEP
jgi:hypothetical protein